MFFELSGILKILKTLEIYRSAVAVEFYCIFRIRKRKFYHAAGLELRRMHQINSILQKQLIGSVAVNFVLTSKNFVICCKYGAKCQKNAKFPHKWRASQTKVLGKQSGVRTRKAQNFTHWRKFKYTLTNRSVKYASNFNDQGFLC